MSNSLTLQSQQDLSQLQEEVTAAKTGQVALLSEALLVTAGSYGHLKRCAAALVARRVEERARQT